MLHMSKKPEEKYELIFCEKPAQAEKIAEALADKKPKRQSVDKVTYYELEHKGKKILVGCAVGHLYTLAEKGKKKWTYPVFEVEWQPAYEVKKTSEFSKKYLETLQKLAKKATIFTVACDLDQEGSVIGFNCIRFIANKKDGKRMKFSTLTKEELIESYENASPHLDFENIRAGETRHFMDYFWGISMSRALTLSIKAAGSFKVMSAGRVQGPTLKIIVDREKEIQTFKPVPFWEIELETKETTAYHKEDKIFDKKRVTQILKNTKDKPAVVSSIKESEFTQAPPTPFDLTTLQTEAYRCFGIVPKEALSIAQELYTAGFISYPRTSSQQLPPSLKYKKIMELIAKQVEYSSLAHELLKGKLTPNEGKKTDPAHPAIYPTGEIKTLKDKSKKIYDLIVRRFLATFAPPAKRKTITAEIDVNKEPFIAKGTITTIKGWHEYYSPYADFKDEEIPQLKEQQKLKDPKVTSEEKETQPPKRYTQASLLKELEKKNLGTKATRAAIIDALYQRNYIAEKTVEATQLGMATIDTLKKYCPEIIEENLTRHFEEEMELIREEKKEPTEVLEEAKKELKRVLDDFKKNEKKIGEGLLEATRETNRIANTVGPCPKCKEGTLMIRRARKFKSFFVGCSAYPKCTNLYSLPSSGLIKTTDKVCEACKHPIVLVIRAGKRPWNFCINKVCPSKEEWLKKQEEKKKLAEKDAAVDNPE
jgi:DNA topoisomerase-1